jgi:hypothetical protein
MIPTQERPGQYWMSGDRAELWFSESGPEAPKAITVKIFFPAQSGTETVLWGG